jgi:hypothetical protein
MSYALALFVSFRGCINRLYTMQYEVVHSILSFPHPFIVFINMVIVYETIQVLSIVFRAEEGS